MAGHRRTFALLATIAILPLGCTWNEEEDYVYRCLPCRSEKYVQTKTAEERLLPSKLSSVYLARHPRHQHAWWYSHRESRSGVINATNGCLMCGITEEEQEAFVRSTPLEKLLEFDRLARSESKVDQQKAVDLIKDRPQK